MSAIDNLEQNKKSASRFNELLKRWLSNAGDELCLFTQVFLGLIILYWIIRKKPIISDGQVKKLTFQ